MCWPKNALFVVLCSYKDGGRSNNNNSGNGGGNNVDGNDNEEIQESAMDAREA